MKIIRKIKKFRFIKILCFILIIYLSWISYLQWKVWLGFSIHEYSVQWIHGNFNSKNDSVKTILLWTSYFGVSPHERASVLNTYIQCSQKCIYTGDKNQILNASAILFHSNAADLNLNDLPLIRHKYQKYIFFTQESPPKAGMRNHFPLWRSFPLNFFNLTMTYRSDSDIPIPYDRFIGINESKYGKPEIYTWLEVETAVARKKLVALQFVGNCYSGSGREGIVRQLSKKIQIDQFGYCAKKKCDKNCEIQVLPNYYFFLAFENNICKDYVTEKFWRIKNLIVPIVLRRNIASKFAPNNSFIAVDDFKNIDELSKYLNNLIQNKTEYLKYFEWTKTFQKKELAWDESYCKLCERLHEMEEDKKKHRWYENIEKWFDPSGDCSPIFLNAWIEGAIFWRKLIAAITGFVVFIILFTFWLICKKNCYIKVSNK